MTQALKPKNKKVVASIEARMGSSRLPGKVLMEIAGKPTLARLIDRLRACRTLDEIVVATSTASADDAIESWCYSYGVTCFRGSEDDVLNRVVEAQRAAASDVVVEITGDCPLTDPEIVDLGVETYFAHDCDIVSNCGPNLTWPMGVYVQVFPFKLLEDVDRTVVDEAVHEHVSLYFYEQPERYRLIELLAPDRWRAPDYRFQLDYPEDLAFQNVIFEKLIPLHGDLFGIEDIMALLRREPDLVSMNIDRKEKAPR
jgi:spore coat polysaccharide biosynthesis protein SpsF